MRFTGRFARRVKALATACRHSAEAAMFAVAAVIFALEPTGPPFQGIAEGTNQFLRLMRSLVRTSDPSLVGLLASRYRPWWLGGQHENWPEMATKLPWAVHYSLQR
jgi:hypothetical protein